MKSSVISVGTELLFGQITNTNTVFLSQQLNELGIEVYYHFTVGDNETRLKEILEYAIQHTDVVITTGGLGPTQDDLTKETIAKVTGRDLKFHDESYRRLESYFVKSHRPITENNIKQTYLPEGCIVLENDYGTAPGFILEFERKVVICFPGPPKEMTNIFMKNTKEYLKRRSDSIIQTNILNCFGIGESLLETKLIDLIDNQTNPTIATYAKDGEVAVRVTASSNSIEDAMEKVDVVVNEIKNRVGDYIFSYNNEDLIDVVSKKLLDKDLTISLAESCTGGLLASKFTSIPGSSQSFDQCIVTYSNKAKMKHLEVTSETLNTYGAVSAETAKEMVIGLKKISGSDLCLSITGIAGPGGATNEKPVGLVYIATLYQDKLNCHELHLSGDRDRIRNHACLWALDIIRKLLQN